MTVKVELKLVVESWIPRDGIEDVRGWRRSYEVDQRQWGKTIEMKAPPTEMLAVQASSGMPCRGVESIQYDWVTEEYEVELERYQEFFCGVREIENELEEDGWEPLPWGGDFGE